METFAALAPTGDADDENVSGDDDRTYALEQSERSSDDEPPSPPTKKRKVELRTAFKQLKSERQRDARAEELVQAVKNWLEKENSIADTESDKVLFNQAMGYILYHVNKQSCKSISKIGWKMYTESPSEFENFGQVSVQDAVAFKHWVEFSKDDMRKMRCFLRKHNLEFPDTNKTLEYRETLFKGEVQLCLGDKGVQIGYIDTIKCTTSDILQIASEKINFVRPVTATMYYKDGADGAGGQKVWNHAKGVLEVDVDSHLYQYGLVPLRLVTVNNGASGDQEVVLWENTKPNSPSWLRTLYLVREKETDQKLCELVIKETDQAKLDLQAGLVLSYTDAEGNEFPVNIQFVITDSMKDIKYKTHISGLGGADCLLCEHQQDDWLDPQCIEAGFKVTRTAEQNMQIYINLRSEEEDGTVIKAPNDYDVRKGLTRMPLTISDQNCITVTHALINGTHWWVKFMPRVMSQANLWRLPKKSNKDNMNELARLHMLSSIKTKTGVGLDHLNKGGMTGTTTTGNAGRTFFSATMTPVLVDLVPDEHKEHIRDVHIKMSVLLRVIESNQIVDIPSFEGTVKDLTTLLATQYPWAKLNFTLHASLQHAAELIKNNGNRGLCALSEEGLESNNKDLRRFMEVKSRKTSLVKQLVDTMTRALERSNPRVQHNISIFKPDLMCSLCKIVGHTKRSCLRRSVSPCVLNPHDLLFDVLTLD